MKNQQIKIFSLFVVIFGVSVLILNNIKVTESNYSSKTEKKQLSKQERKKARTDFFFNMLRDPQTNSIPSDIRNRELAHAKKISKSLNKTSSVNFDWTEVGPNDVGGRTRALAIDLNNSNTVIAAGVSGGIWKSTDNGDTWSFKSKPGDLLSITSIVQDPRDGFTNIWYAAGGELNGNSASDQGGSARFRGNGIFKSVDNGENWTLINSTTSNPTKFDSNFDYVAKLLISSTTGSLFATANGEGIIKSTDDGETFTTVLGGLNDHLYSDIIEKQNGQLIAIISESGFNETHVNSPGIYTSVDDGDSWTDITPAEFSIVHQRSVLGTSKLDSPIFYVLTYTGESSGSGEEVLLYKLSTDGSTTENLTEFLPAFGSEYFENNGFVYSQGGYNLAINVKPDDDDFVLLGGTSLFRSTDGVSTKLNSNKYDWIGGYHATEFFYPGCHPDIHIITFDPNDPNKVWIGHDGGLTYSDNISTESYQSFFPWISKNNGYNVTQFYTVSLSNLEGDNRIMGGAQDNGTPYFKTNDLTFETSDVSTGDGAYCHFADKLYAYASVQYGSIYRLRYNDNNEIARDDYYTTDVTPEGAEGQLFVNPFIIDPNPYERYMYYPAGNTLWRNDLIGIQSETNDKWEELPSLAMPSNFTISTLAVSDQNPEHVLYYAGYNSEASPKIYRLENAHEGTSGYSDVSIEGADSGTYVHHISVNPNDGDEIMVVLSNYNIVGLYHSTDGGSSYTAVEGNLTGDDDNPGPSLRNALILPYDDSYNYFAATSTGLYSTTNLDGDNTVWELESPNGLGNVVVEYLDARTIDNTIAVATHGRGIFIGTPSGAVGVEDNNILTDGYKLNQNYPNPFNPSTKIEFNIPQFGDVNLTIYNNLGERIKTLVNKELQKGEYSVDFNAQGLTSGIYFYKLSVADFSETKKMMLIK